MAKIARALPLTATALVCLTSPASAARVSLETGDCRYECADYVALVAARAERNDVTLATVPAPHEGSAVRAYDPRTRVAAGHGCGSREPHTVRCRYTYLAFTDVRLGDLDDRLDASGYGWGLTAHGGRGDDVVVGGGEEDRLYGGPGDDMLDGGPGRDTVAFGWPVRHLVVDLAAHTARGDGSGSDSLARIENADAIQSRRARLLGDAHANVLDGGRGGVLNGRGGRDHLTTGAGGRIYAGPGDDEVFGGHARSYRAGAVASIGCGPGLDVVEDTALGDLVRPSCDVVEPDIGPSFLHLVHRPREGRPFATLRFDCNRAARCPVTIAARIGSRHGPVVARRHERPRRTSTYDPHAYPLVLDARGRAELKRRGRLRVVVYYREGPFRGDPRFLGRFGFTMALEH